MIVTSDNRATAIGSEMGGVTSAGGAFARVEPMLTAQQLKDSFLFGIPLYAFLPDPITKQRQEFTNEMLTRAITRAVNKIELHTGVAIQAVRKTRRLPFDRIEYQCLGYFQLQDAPILQVHSLAVKPSGDVGAVYVIDKNWIEVGGFQRGEVHIIPFLPATTMTYAPMASFPGTTGSGGAAFLSILGMMGFVPFMWQIEYTCGFDDGRIPVVLNELIGVTAAQIVLDELGATNRIGQYSVGLDSAQQSVQTGGPNVYQQRIDNLEKERVALSNKFKKKFKNALFSNNV